MATIDRFVRRAQDRFDPFEGLVGAVLGRESGGRRRVAVIASDQRVLLITLRPEPPTEFAYPNLHVNVTISEGSASIHLKSPTVERVAERITDISGAQMLAEMIRRRADIDDAPTVPARIVLLPPVQHVETA
jgi:hypothetical protein